MKLRGIKATTLFERLAVLAGLAGLTGLTGCGKGDARLSGHLIEAASRPVYLERVIPGAATPQVDTIVTNDKGEFDFRVTLPDGQPTIFNLRYDGDMVPLLISPREKVSVFSLGDLDGYRVSGSPESELVWRLHGILSEGAAALDSISNRYNRSTPGSEHQERIRKAWYDKYLGVKRRQIGFIVENASSLAAVYALYQRLPGDQVLFGGDNDYIYYQMVADSVSRRYPDSRYVKALERENAARTAERDLVNRISAEGVLELDYPEIDLPNMYGQRVRLSSLAGNVIVLDFWVTTDTRSRLNNAEMKELWEAHSGEGLAIYQVSLDTSKPLWVNAVQEQKLPWTTVCDFRGEATVPVRLYNITAIPSNFIIDREGNIAAKNLYGDALAKKVKDLL
jgi:peroxiredoxin